MDHDPLSADSAEFLRASRQESRPWPVSSDVRHAAQEDLPMDRKTIALAAAALFATAAGTAQAQAKMEKCYGVVKAGQNDCATNTSSCSGTSKKDAQADAWINVPAGTCAKLVGGKLDGKKS